MMAKEAYLEKGDANVCAEPPPPPPPNTHTTTNTITTHSCSQYETQEQKTLHQHLKFVRGPGAI